MSVRSAVLCLVMVWSGLLAAQEQAAPPEAADGATVQQAEESEKQRIRLFRSQEEARFAAEEVQCYQRFAVNDCLTQVRRARRDVLADLRRQEMSINDAQRKRRAAQQLLRADEKQSR
jgi:hypothetical protein